MPQILEHVNSNFFKNNFTSTDNTSKPATIRLFNNKTVLKNYTINKINANTFLIIKLHWMDYKLDVA